MKNIKTVLFAVIAALILSLSAFAVSAPEIFGDSDIRTSEPLGLRVKAVLSADSALDEATTEYGFLVTRKVFLSGNGLTEYDLTLDSKVYYDKGIARGMVNGEVVDKFYDKTDTELYFAGHFYGIAPRYYTDTIVARPYIINGLSIFYGEPFEMSLYDTAKKIYSDKQLYDSLPRDNQQAIYSIIVAVDGEPYFIKEDDLRIVISSCVVKNENPTYSVSYNLYDPYTGETLMRVKGRKSSKNYDEISSMVLSGGELVPLYDGVVQDTTDGYADGSLEKFSPVWIRGYDGEMLSVSEYDSTVKCKDCVENHVLNNNTLIFSDIDTPVSVFDGDFESIAFSSSDMNKVMTRDFSLLCCNNGLYSDYIKAYVCTDDGGKCSYIIAIVNDGENSALDEKCLNHTRFDVDFYVDDVLYTRQTILYNATASLPLSPEKEGYTFVGWSLENGEAVDVESVKITENTSFCAVFEKNPVYYTVTYAVNGEEYASYQVLENEHPNVPENPALDGYTFVGWSLENGEAVDVESVKITENTSFCAVFEKNPVYYTVTYTVNGEEYASYQVLENEHPNVPENPVLDGYEFLGWAEAENGDAVNPENISVNADIVYFAVFEKLIVYCDVTFMFDGNVLVQYKVLSGETVTAPDVIPETAEGYKFMGWSMSSDNDTKKIILPSEYSVCENTVFHSVIITNPNSEEFMEKLTRGYTQLKSIKRSTGLTKEVLKLLTDCIGYVLEDADKFIYIDKVYVGLTYAETVARAKQIVNEEMSSSEKSQFVNLITKTVDQDVQDFLYEYFDISTKI